MASNDKSVVMIQKKSPGFIPIPFGNIDCAFYCLQCNLQSLKNCPESIGSSSIFHNTFHCSGNKLTSLEYLPKEMYYLQCYNNRFKSLDGIDSSKNIADIRISYSPTLPLLRLLCSKKRISFKDKLGADQKEYVNLENILNKYIQDTSMSLSEKRIRCKLELLEYPEYRMNARW